MSDESDEVRALIATVEQKSLDLRRAHGVALPDDRESALAALLDAEVRAVLAIARPDLAAATSGQGSQAERAAAFVRWNRTVSDALTRIEAEQLAQARSWLLPVSLSAMLKGESASTAPNIPEPVPSILEAIPLGPQVSSVWARLMSVVVPAIRTIGRLRRRAGEAS